MRFVFASLGLAALLAAGATLNAQEKAVKVGDKAPAFESVDENGKTWKSSDHVGKKVVVLYFFPADFTGGCTAQACSFRDEKSALEGVEVLGVSGDTPATHALFKKYHGLNFTLLADEKGELAKKFGVPVGKGGTVKTEVDKSGTKAELTRGATIQRYTVVIDKAGNIAALDAVSSPKGDAKRVESLVKGLQSK